MNRALSGISSLHPQPNETVNKFQQRVITYINANSKEIRDDIKYSDADTILEHQREWTEFLVRYYYKYCLNEQFGLYKPKQPYGKGKVKNTTGAPMMDYEFIWEEERLIDRDLWGCTGILLWLRIARMIYSLHKDDVSDFDIETINMTEIIQETIALWKPTTYSVDEEQVTLLGSFLTIMARVGKYIDLCTHPNIYVLRGSMELYVSTMSMIDPGLLIPNYDPHKVLNVPYEKQAIVQENMEAFLNGWKPTRVNIEIIKRTLLCLVGYPTVRRQFILKELYDEPEKYYLNQFNIHLFKPSRQREAMKTFQADTLDTIQKYNPENEPISYFWNREENKTVYSNDFKLVVLQNIVQNEMMYEGTIPTVVYNIDMFARHQQTLTERSRTCSLIIKLDPFHHWSFYNGVFSRGSTEAVISTWNDHIKQSGIPKMESWESNPSVYEWVKIHPSICKAESILTNTSIKKKTITLGVRRFTTPTRDVPTTRTGPFVNSAQERHEIMEDPILNMGEHTRVDQSRTSQPKTRSGKTMSDLLQ